MTDAELSLVANPEITTTALEVSTGRKRDGSLFHKRIAGYAFLPSGATVYEIKLMMFPRHTYYLRRNRDSNDRYTAFSKRVADEEGTKLLNPVGIGRHSDALENFIELYFPLLGTVLFIDLIPKN